MIVMINYTTMDSAGLCIYQLTLNQKCQLRLESFSIPHQIRFLFIVSLVIKNIMFLIKF